MDGIRLKAGNCWVLYSEPERNIGLRRRPDQTGADQVVSEAHLYCRKLAVSGVAVGGESATSIDTLKVADSLAV